MNYILAQMDQHAHNLRLPALYLREILQRCKGGGGKK